MTTPPDAEHYAFGTYFKLGHRGLLYAWSADGWMTKRTFGAAELMDIMNSDLAGRVKNTKRALI